MNNKVYLLEHIYSHYNRDVCGIFSSKEKAVAYIMQADKNCYDRSESARAGENEWYYSNEDQLLTSWDKTKKKSFYIREIELQ